MKKGIQYSHYLGTQLQEITSFTWLAKDDILKGDNDNALKMLDEVQKQIKTLRDKVAELDILNGMDY